MALPVLDGNQSATTLSSVVTGGEHIVAHSVVSLGTTAIANITSAVSGVNIGGTVTANINGTPTVTIPQLNRVIQSVATDGVVDATLNFVKIGGHQDGSNQTAHIVHVSAGGAMKVDATDSSVTFGAVRGTVTISNFPSTQTIAGTVTAIAHGINIGGTNGVMPLNIAESEEGFGNGRRLAVSIIASDGAEYGSDGFPLSVSGTVTVSNTTISSPVFVKICGEKSGAGPNEPREIQTDDSGLLYVRLAPSNSLVSDPVVYDPVAGAAYINVRQYSAVTVGNTVTIGSLPAISGTVTANAKPYDKDNILRDIYEGVDEGVANDVIAVHIKGATGNSVLGISSNPLAIFGTVTVGNSVTIGSVPNGSLTTRFGTPTTANTAFATSAVTNANRKYLLIQNVTTGSNVITVGIGFTPTTTQGIQLTAGAGITFESSYIPTGQIFVLSSVTASNFTILEA